MWGTTWIPPRGGGAAAPPNPGNSPSWPCTAPQGHPALRTGGAAAAMVTRARLSSLIREEDEARGKAASVSTLSPIHTHTLTDTRAHTHIHSRTLDTHGHDTHSRAHTHPITDTHAHGHVCALKDIHTHGHSYNEHMRVHGHSYTLKDTHTRGHRLMDIHTDIHTASTCAYSQTLIHTQGHSCIHSYTLMHLDTQGH